ncbi:MAG TPA: ribonuclease E/G, partial [Silvibacterium sp.]|nr:ribonuclease E/G [Silvibacterium sp.]
MSKEICISTTPHETRLAILENDELTEIYYERENEYTLAGSIYKGKVTRVLPGMQSAFVDVGLERDAFLYVTDFLEEQDEGADFENVGGNGQRSRKESGRESGPESSGRTRHPEASVEIVSEPSETEDSHDTESPSGTRRWRGRRGRRRGFRSRGQQEDSRPADALGESAVGPGAIQIESEPFETEPEEPREYHVSVPAQSQRILLPGESLSKYGGTASSDVKQPEAAAQAASATTNYTAPKPSTLVEKPIQWDGGLLMPGESLSRYRSKVETQAAEAVVEVIEPDAAVAESYVQEASPTGIAEVQLVAEPPEEAATPLVDAVQEFTSVEAARPDVIAIPELPSPIHAEWEKVEVTAHEPVATAEIADDEVHEEVHEFEPESASASHRVDPAPPSEFRVSSVTEEEDELPVADADLAQIVHEVREEAPIESYSAAVAVEYAEEEHDAQATEVADQLFGFAPGSGVLEEEVIDDEEYDFEPIHRHADEHDSEDLEEETLDHAGELGEIVRDSHLDQRLSSGAGVEESEEEDVEAEDEEEEDEEASFKTEEAGEPGIEQVAAEPARPRRDGDRGGERRGGRRGDRRGDRRGGHSGARRHSAQTMDLPIISDLLKQGQEILVQIAKEPIAKKGARITSHIALPGRFLVFMPTVNHVGVSRKISSDEERQRLKRILISEKGDATGGFIVRTAADGASEDELRADLRFLISLWSDIKQREEASKAPALIYHDLNLVERVLRDQVSDNFSA